MSIDIRNFNDENIVQTGNIDSVILHIGAYHTGLNSQQQMGTFLDCLTQIRNSRGKYKGRCDSVLCGHPLEAQRVINNNKFKRDPSLKDTLSRIQYLTSSYPYRVIHHLQESYLNNKGASVTYLTGGMSLLLTSGLLNALTPYNNDSKENTAWIMVSFGGAIVGFPIFNSFYRAAKDEP